MEQILTLNMNPAAANDLIAALEVARRQGDFRVARTAVSIISELIRQDEEFKAKNQAPIPAVPIQTAE